MSGPSTSVAGEGYGYGYRPPFTAVQWQELEHQAMIYKYLVAGVPVPPDLVVPIRRSFEALSARFFQHQSLNYCSYYGKKFDPEPGRCRRTDGKKWRCSKDAYPDSKYCERHMHRGRNRSRKPVESQSTSQSLSTAMSHVNTGSSYGNCATKLGMEPASYGTENKEFRYPLGMTLNAGERDFSQETSAGVRSLGIGSSTDSTWCLLPTQVPSNPMFKTKNEPQFLGGVSELTIDSTMPKQRQQHCFFGSEIDSPGALKQEQHSIRPFLSEWPTTTKESWSNLENDGSNQNAFSTTQLSISIPVPPSSFSSRSDCSQNGESKPELIKTYQSGF
nr:growth-regulating factor 4-like isoform X1 [Ipomoea batatas]